MNRCHLHIHNLWITKMRQNRNKSSSKFHRMPSSLFPVNVLPLQWQKPRGRLPEGLSWLETTSVTPNGHTVLLVPGAWMLIKLFSLEPCWLLPRACREREWCLGQCKCSVLMCHPPLHQHCQSKCEVFERGAIDMMNGLEIDGKIQVICLRDISWKLDQYVSPATVASSVCSGYTPKAQHTVGFQGAPLVFSLEKLSFPHFQYWLLCMILFEPGVVRLPNIFKSYFIS